MFSHPHTQTTHTYTHTYIPRNQTQYSSDFVLPNVLLRRSFCCHWHKQLLLFIRNSRRNFRNLKNIIYNQGKQHEVTFYRNHPLNIHTTQLIINRILQTICNKIIFQTQNESYIFSPHWTSKIVQFPLGTYWIFQNFL